MVFMRRGNQQCGKTPVWLSRPRIENQPLDLAMKLLVLILARSAKVKEEALDSSVQDVERGQFGVRG